MHRHRLKEVFMNCVSIPIPAKVADCDEVTVSHIYAWIRISRRGHLHPVTRDPQIFILGLTASSLSNYTVQIPQTADVFRAIIS
jgi:hypothetical protein